MLTGSRKRGRQCQTSLERGQEKRIGPMRLWHEDYLGRASGRTRSKRCASLMP